MDVASFFSTALARKGCRGGALIALLGLISACAPSSDKFSTTSVDKASAECETSSLSNQFLVTWADDSITVENAKDAAELEATLLKQHLGEIKFAEHDQRVLSFHHSSIASLRTSARAHIAASTQSTSTSDFRAWGAERISAPDAWKIAKGEGIIVAVVDSGVDLTHPQLKNQLAVNAGEIPADQIDNDKNGYVDDVIGYDFAENSPNVKDTSGHGTHVSGIILAEHTDSSQLKGIAPNAKLLPLDFMDGTDGSISDAIRAIEYATSRGARVINASWGGSCSKTLQKVVATLENRGVLFVTAAGNGNSYGIGQDLGRSPTYPAAFDIPGQITVGAVNVGDALTGFSNYSSKYVHIVAPGQDIFSSYPSTARCPNTNATGYCYEDGTSMATPFVSGAAALIWSYRPKATVAQVKQALLNSVDKGDYLVSSGGRLNVRAALDEIARLVNP